MKRLTAWMCGSAAALSLLAGCTSVNSTQKFNGLGLSAKADKAVCHTAVEIPCYLFFGLPIVGGSASGDGKMSIFQNNADVESAMCLLTSEIRSRNGARVINAQTFVFEEPVFLGLFQKRVMEASGTGVRTRNEAVKRAGENFDREPVPSY